MPALVSLSARPQTEQTDSVVRLISAKFIEQQETPEGLVRKAMDATFLHNGTYLICDSAVWKLDSSVINCIGNVRMIQGETELTSDKLDYLIDLDLAQFRGTLVQLRNKSENILRTRILDYNTKDSIAVFSGGASMKSENGQIIESDNGQYFNATEFYIFEGNVNMFADSVFVKTNTLEYESEPEKAWFTSYVDFWKEENMLSADGGWYDRKKEIFFFKGNVHALSENQESWSDTLYYYRSTGDVLMLGTVQIQDTTRNTAAVGNYLFYEDSLSRVTMMRDAAVAMWEENEGQIDTTYFGADTLIYYTMRHCDIPVQEVEAAEERLATIIIDPVQEYRRRVAEEAAAAAAAAMEEQQGGGRGAPPGGRAGADPQGPGAEPEPPLGGDPGGEPPPLQMPSDSLSMRADSLGFPRDSLAMFSDSLGFRQDSLGMFSDSLSFRGDSLGMYSDSLSMSLDSLSMPLDSLGMAADSLAGPRDTTKIGFITGMGNVKIFRETMQVRCDSLRFCELDSIARFYKDPVVWNEGRRQYTADSLFVLVINSAVDRASLMSNAFIAVYEDSLHFDQIRSSEVLAYFDSTAALRRFDALGGVSALFYLEENDELATVNKVESTMLSATLQDGEVQNVYYFQSPKSDAYPVVQLPAEDRQLRGFSWRPEERPKSPLDVTSLQVRPSNRAYYESLERPRFIQTERYFSGMMDELYASLEEAARRKREAERRREAQRKEAEEASDSLAVQDSLVMASDSLLHLGDSLVMLQDSIALADSLAVGEVVDEEEEYMSERELRRALRIARRDAKWAALDARDAEKAAQKAAKKEARLQKKEESRKRRQEKQDARDAERLQKYIERFEKQKERHERKQKSKPAGERPSGTEEGRDLPTTVEGDGEAS